MRKMGSWLAAVTMALVVVTAVVADEEKIPLDKVPEVVMKALKAKYPKAEIVAAELGDQDGKKVYEFDLKEGDKKWEVSFTPEGKFVGSEEPIKEEDLPAKVKEAFKKKYADVKFVSAEKETTGEGKEAKIVYEIVFSKGDDKIEAQFDPEGKFIAEEKVKK